MKIREITVLTTVLVALSWGATPAVALKAGAGGASVGVSSNGGSTKADVGLGGGGTDASGAHATLGGGDNGGTNASGSANLGGGTNANANASLGGNGGSNAHVGIGQGGTDGTSATGDLNIGTGTTGRVVVGNGGTDGTNGDISASIGGTDGVGVPGSGTPMGNAPGSIADLVGGNAAAPQENADDPNSTASTAGVGPRDDNNGRLNSQLGSLAGLTPAALRGALDNLDPADVRKIKKSCAQLRAGGGNRNAMAVCKIIASL